ncbi:MAG TPA: hypothetical protein VJH89_03000, partial [Patescibacteria group bacterium]|nr:hypothetical protein [Patescibacteria group bacterium]
MNYRHFLVFGFFFCFSLVFSGISPAPAHAGLFSFLREISSLKTEVTNLKTQVSEQRTQLAAQATVPSCTPVEVRYNPSRNMYWVNNTDPSSHSEIEYYHIVWFNGSLSQKYIPGVNDVDPKYPNRRAWSYFYGHIFVVSACPGAFDPG